MANARYNNLAQLSGSAGLNVVTDTITVYLIDTGSYTFSAAHAYVSDLTGVVASANLASKSLSSSGLFDAADTVLPSVTGAQSEALVIAKNTGTASTSPLLLYLDTGVGGLPITPDGSNINIQWNAAGIYQF